MASEKGSSKADTLIKMVLVFFISLLSFSVGTFVGKQVSDSDHRRLALEGEYKGGREVASTDEASSEEGEKISDKEVESLTEEFVNKEKGREVASTEGHGSEEHDAAPAEAEHGNDSGYKTYKGKKDTRTTAAAHDEHAPAPTPAKDAHAAPAPAKDAHAAPAPAGHAPAAAAAGKPAKPAAHAADAPQKVAKKVAEGHAPTDGKAEERKPNAVLPSVASSAIGKFSVQVASYADEKQAKEHAADLKGKGWTAFYLSANVQGHTWYRVLVGLFENPKSADEYRAQLMKEAGIKSAIVQKIVQ